MKIIFTSFLLSFFVYSQDYYYFDGGVRKKIKISEEFIAQKPVSSTTTIRSGSSGGAVVHENATLQIIRKTSIGTSSTGTRSTGTGSTSEELPVFEAENGSLVAIPGGIIVSFKSGVPLETINNWVATNNLTLKKVISLKNKSHYLFDTPAGLATMTLVNQFESESIIQEVKPDFWMEIKHRADVRHFEKPQIKNR